MHKLRNNIYKINDLDLEFYAEKLKTHKDRPEMIQKLLFIKNEIIEPFKNTRKQYKEINDLELTYEI